VFKDALSLIVLGLAGVLILAVLALIGLAIWVIGKDTVYRFEVDTASHEAVSAELTMCGNKTLLDRSGTIFTASVTDSCEANAEILVRFPDQSSAICLASYVVPDMGRDFRFRLSEGRCELVSETIN
jgi:Na+-transporting methylmalonyl-CoA/oxaloacetate decarboxylase gamma subunit